jgi:ribosomal protein S18 acetylase RimI-like enzyme
MSTELPHSSEDQPFLVSITELTEDTIPQYLAFLYAHATEIIGTPLEQELEIDTLDYTKLLQDPLRRILVARNNNQEIVGSLETELISGDIKEDKRGYINIVATHTALRKKSIASQLVSNYETYLQTQGVQQVQALIDEANTKAIGLFTKLGYSKGTEEEEHFFYYKKQLF